MADASDIAGLNPLWTATGWVLTKALDTVAAAATDGSVKSHLATVRMSLAVRLRGMASQHGVFGHRPGGSATNHDLLRALRAAWVRVAQQKLGDIRSLQNNFEQTQEFRDWPGLRFMADTLGQELTRLELAAASRTMPFETVTPVEDRLLMLIPAMAEQRYGNVESATTDELTSAFVSGVLDLPVDWGGLRERVAGILRKPLTTNEIHPGALATMPGEAILDRFVENLKSGFYPEASRAYDILLGGLIREDIAALQVRLGDQALDIRDVVSDIRDDFSGLPETIRTELDDALAEHQREIRDGLSKVEQQIQQLEAVLGARNHDLKRTLDAVASRRNKLTECFFGRQAEIEMMFDRLRDSPNTLTVVTAPAGTGKSGFMAQVARLAECRGFFVVAHFVSREDDDTTERENVLGHIALRLRTLFPEATLGRLDDRSGRLVNEIDHLLCQTQPDNRPVLVLVDGLDEMSERLPVPVPRNNLARNIHWVVSCRTGDGNDTPPAIVEWTSADSAHRFGIANARDVRYRLPPLGRNSIVLWLTDCLGKVHPIETIPLVARLEAASEGLAVFLQPLIQDVVKAIGAGKTIHSVEAGLADLPAPFSAYLRREMAQKPVDEHPPYGLAERRFLGLVAVALGPLGDTELRQLVSGIDPRNPPPAVRRWLSRIEGQGYDAWIMQHPRLAEPFVQALEDEAEEALEALTNHCRQAISERRNRRCRYAALWGARHLVLSDAPDDTEIIMERLGNPEFLIWRMENATSEQEMIRTINRDYYALEGLSQATPPGTSQLARLFASLAPSLLREART